METDVQVVKQMERELAGPSYTHLPSEPLHHYCDQEALVGILKSKRIWASHIRYLNDKSELVRGEAIIRSLVQKELGGVASTHLKWFLTALDSPKWAMSQMMDVFVASFSTQPNSLPQWKMYGGDGLGFSIGFKDVLAADEEIAAPDKLGLVLVECIYDPGEFESVCQRELESFLPDLDVYLQTYGRTFENAVTLASRASGILFTRVQRHAWRLKDPAFHTEHEWRLIALPGSQLKPRLVQFRRGRTGLVPYVPIPLSKNDGPLALTSIMAGPRQDEDQAIHSTRLLLQTHGYDPDLAGYSAIPYR